MRKSFMNIKHFVDSSVRHRIDKNAHNSHDNIGDDLIIVERQFEDLRQICIEAEKRISTMLQSLSSSALDTYTQNVQASLNSLSNLTTSSQSQVLPTTSDQYNPHSTNLNAPPTSRTLLSNNNPECVTSGLNQSTNSAELESIKKQHKKLPIVGFLRFLVKTCHKLRQDSLLGTTLTHCSHLQSQVTKLYMTYEKTIETQCLKPIQHMLEVDIPNVIKIRKLFTKACNDLESVKGRYNGASQKQQHQQVTAHSTNTSYTITQSNSQNANVNKLDQLKKELDEVETRFEQAKDIYAVELYTFVSRETEIVNVFTKFYQHQADYHHQVSMVIQNSLPPLINILDTTPRRAVFGIPLDEHLQCTRRPVSILIELCVHLLYSNALNEEGLFRIPGSSTKIKKLKGAINAWFVTLANHNELPDNRDQEAGQQHTQKIDTARQSTVLAIYNLFKDIVGQRPPQIAKVGDANQNNHATSTRDNSNLTLSDSSTMVKDSSNNCLVFDVHTVAGLLKLYLRELPEPLLANALYNQWVSSCVKSHSDELERANALERVVRQLPKSNYDNLRFLIRFLHLLTCHQEKNKMTATNLAITMAPSLIWSPSESHGSNSDENQLLDEGQALQMQMSSVGMSASIHALIVENLIKHAERLFPDNINFAISYLDDEYNASSQTNVGRMRKSLIPDRFVKSTSPTGSSTESTSSFSSSSNISSGKISSSVDGLVNDYNASTPSVKFTESHKNYLTQEKQPIRPPIPPAPNVKSHQRHASDTGAVFRTYSHKPPAPPVPPPCTLKRQSRPSASHSPSDDKHPVNMAPEIGKGYPDQPRSLRGTGSIILTENINNLTTPGRPSVPPPARPDISAIEEINGVEDRIDIDESNKASHSKASSLRNDYEDINALDMIDDPDLSDHTSPVVSIDSVSGDDSSFDDHSLDHSWAECESDKRQQNMGLDKNARIGGHSRRTSIIKPEISTQPTPGEDCAGEINSVWRKPQVDGEIQEQQLLSPSKPSRSINQKTSAKQSTPL